MAPLLRLIYLAGISCVGYIQRKDACKYEYAHICNYASFLNRHDRGGWVSHEGEEELPECPVATAVALIGGKWKLLIIRNLRVRPWRFNELRRDLEGISRRCSPTACGRWRMTGWSFAMTMARILPRRVWPHRTRPPDDTRHGLARRLRRLSQDDCFVADAPLGDASHGGVSGQAAHVRHGRYMAAGGREGSRLRGSLQKLAKPLCPACEGAVLRPLPGFFAACQVVSAEDRLVRGN